MRLLFMLLLAGCAQAPRHEPPAAVEPTAVRWWFDGAKIKVEQFGQVQTVDRVAEFGSEGATALKVEGGQATITHAR